MAPGVCPRCGGPNPRSAAFCQFCSAPLPGVPSPEPVPVRPGGPDSFQLATSGQPEYPVARVVLLIFGILLFVGGLVLFGIAASVHQTVQSFNQACMQNPTCTPESDPSGAITGVGVAVLIIGIILLIVAGILYRGD
ncbi:MAG TPA: zinc ribbon domain-containing protein [Thermoplasmata archaeon]|nr:zinc ribbon domain-containing protein [Thermoplasmata archaeon]